MICSWLPYESEILTAWLPSNSVVPSTSPVDFVTIDFKFWSCALFLDPISWILSQTSLMVMMLWLFSLQAWWHNVHIHFCNSLLLNISGTKEQVSKPHKLCTHNYLLRRVHPFVLMAFRNHNKNLFVARMFSQKKFHQDFCLSQIVSQNHIAMYCDCLTSACECWWCLLNSNLHVHWSCANIQNPIGNDHFCRQWCARHLWRAVSIGTLRWYQWIFVG